jgi:hypothetical protein
MTSLLLCGAGGRSGGAGGALDGLSPTAAYSFSRNLLSAYGGVKYTTNAGLVDALMDQSGNARDLTQSTGGNRPTPTTAGPNSIACGDFDGSGDHLLGSVALSTLISNSDGFVIATVLADTVSLNNANVYQNNCAVGDSSGYMGLFAKNVSGTTPTFFAYNWDGNSDSPTGTTFSLATPYVLTWRHEGGTLYLSVNGGTETTVASGNTSTMTGNFRLGANPAFDGKIFEAATFSTIPNSGQRTALIQNMGLYVGASV